MNAKDKKIAKELRRLLEKLKSAVNKYEIQYIAGDLGAYSGSKLALVLPELLELFQTASIRHTLNGVKQLITKTGAGARHAVPIYMEKLLTNDQWLISGYRYGLEQLGWVYKDDPDELDGYIAELTAVIAQDEIDLVNREAYTRKLAALIDAADSTMTGEKVLAILDNQNAFISANIMNACWSAGAEAKQQAELLRQLQYQHNRRKTLQEVIDNLDEHSRTGWQSHEQIYMVISSFLGENQVVRQVKLFGSRSKKTYRPDSDIDLALVMRTKDKEEALQIYRDQHAMWREWFAEQLPYEIDLNLYIDEETTPEIHNGLHTSGGHRSYGS